LKTGMLVFLLRRLITLPKPFRQNLARERLLHEFGGL
jgi:hypothetical protein